MAPPSPSPGPPPLISPISSGELLLVGLLISIILVSIVGNCLVCVAIFTDRRLRKLGNAFIVSLAIADLFVSCLVMTFALCNDLMNYWIFGDWFCDVWISFDIMCCTASILNLCAISLDRFIHIKDCLLYNQWMTRRVAVSAVIIIWFISALVSFVPINLGWHKPDHQFGSGAGSGSQRAVGGSVQLRSVRLVLMEAEQRQAAAVWPLEQPFRQEGTSLHRSVAGPKLDYSSGSEEAVSAAAAAFEAIENQSPMQLLQEQQNASIEPGARAAAGKSHREAAGRRRKQDGAGGASLASQLANSDSATIADAATRAAVDEDDDGDAPRRTGEDFVSSARGGGRLLAPLPGSSSGRRAAAVVDGGGRIATTSSPPEAAQFNQVESNPQDGSQIGKLNPPPLPSSGGASSITRRRRGNRNNVSAAAAAHSIASRQTPPISSPAMQTTNAQQQQQLDYQPADGERAPSRPDVPGGAGGGEPAGLAGSQQASAHHAQCMLTLTPTYAIISSTISFYIPCIIMLGLYTKLFACARRHVRNIQAISKAPAPINRPANEVPLIQGIAASTTSTQHAPDANSGRPPFRTWLKLGPKPKPIATNAQTQNDKSIMAHNKQMHNHDPQNQQTTTTTTAARCSFQKLVSRDKLLSENSSHLPAIIHGPVAQSVESNVTTLSDNTIKNQCSATGDQLPATNNDDEAATQSTTDKSETANNFIMTVPAEVSEQRDMIQTSSPQVASQHSYKSKTAIEERQPFLYQAGSGLVPPSSAIASGRSKSSCLTAAQQQQGFSKVSFQAPNQQQSGQLATHKAAVTLGIIMGTFLFCWVPFFCLNIIKAFCVDCIPSSVFRAFTWLGYANSALNPIIYGIHNSEFRCAFNRIFFKHLNIKNSRYYLNRRFSYDQRHPINRQQQNCHGRSGNHHDQTLKSDAVT